MAFSFIPFSGRESREKYHYWDLHRLLQRCVFSHSADQALAESAGIKVRLKPNAVRNAGAQWRIRMVYPWSTGWEGPFDDNYRKTVSWSGTNQAEFEVKATDVPGWITPDSVYVWVRNGHNENLQIWYTEDQGTTTTTSTTSTTTTPTTHHNQHNQHDDHHHNQHNHHKHQHDQHQHNQYDIHNPARFPLSGPR